MKKGIKQSLFFIILNATLCTIASNRDTKHSHESATKRDADAKAAAQTLVPTAQGTSPSIRYSFDLIKPIQPIVTLSGNNTDKEKIALFERVMETNPSPTYRLYHMAHDPVIIRYIRSNSEKEFALHSLIDAEAKTILAHAIENNDAPFVSNYCMHLLNAKEKKEAFLYAGDMNRPRVMLALIEKRKYESEEAGVYRAISKLNDLPHDQIPNQAIQSMLDLVDQHTKDRATYDQKLYKLYQRAVSLIHVREKTSADNQAAGEFPFEAISREQLDQMQRLSRRFPSNKVIAGSKLHDLIAQMLMPRRSMMVPQLETAIQTGNEAQIDALLQEGCSANDRNGQGLDALEVAADCGQDAILTKLLKFSTYIGSAKKRAMIENVQRKKEAVHLVDEKLSQEQKLEYRKRYDEMLKALKKDTLIPRLQKGSRFARAIAQNNIGNFVDTLRTGMNPNALNNASQPYSFSLLRANPLFLRLLFRFGGNPNIIIKDQNNNKKYTLFTWAMLHSPEISEQLLIADVDLFAATEKCNNLIRAFWTENPDHLKAILFPKKPLQQRFNPNMAVSYKGQQISLFIFAVNFKRPKHFQLLIDAGTDPNNLDANGTPIAATFVQSDDSEYLKIALNPRTAAAKKLNPNTLIRGTDGVRHPLLYWAMKNNQPQNFQNLLDAGADIYIVDGENKHIAVRSLMVDIKYLNMLLEKGLATEKLYSDGTNSLTLIAWADKLNKPEHKRLLENPNGTNICAIQ